MFNIEHFKAEELIKEFGTPLYIYNESIIRKRYKELDQSFNIPNKKILYACKANSNLEILKILKEEGAGIDAVSQGEVFLALKAGFDPKNILFTGNNVTNEELDYIVENDVLVNIDSLSLLERYGKKYPNTSICVRINPNVGDGHHDHVITGGVESKFGIYISDIEKIHVIANKYNLKIIGIHQHIGSNILNIESFNIAIDIILDLAQNFQNLDFIDIGGGLGVPYKPEEKKLDMECLKNIVNEKFAEFCQKYKKDVSLWIEPGRFLVAESGYLLVNVNTIKTNPCYKFVGTNSGFNHLVRPTMYDSYHEIINLSNLDGQKEVVTVCGNICESGDIFAKDRLINEVQEGDILAILNAGAYGYSMASNYNFRPLPAEIIINKKEAKLIRRRESFEELLRNQIFS